MNQQVLLFHFLPRHRVLLQALEAFQVLLCPAELVAEKLDPAGLRLDIERLDVLAVRQWGYPVVGLLGTNVRPDQVDQLRAFSRAYLVLDSDDAGFEATLALYDAIGPTAVPVALPDDVKDPAELATRGDGQGVFAEALLKAVGKPAPAESSDSAPKADL